MEAVEVFQGIKGLEQILLCHTVEKSKKKLGSGYSKIFQLTILVSKLDFRDLKLKIDKEYLMYTN